MKNVRLVLLFSVLAAVAACSGTSIAGPESDPVANPAGIRTDESTASPDTAVARDGGPLLGSGG